MKGLAQEARDLLEQNAWGLLSSHSARHAGFPFGSVTPYAWSEAHGGLLLHMSTLAEHTRNVASNPRASMLVLEKTTAADLQEAGRLTVLGTVTALPPTERETLQALYVARHAQAAQLFSMADFSFFVLRVEHARFIAGFGKMGWLTGEELSGT